MPAGLDVDAVQLQVTLEPSMICTGQSADSSGLPEGLPEEIVKTVILQYSNLQNQAYRVQV